MPRQSLQCSFASRLATSLAKLNLRGFLDADIKLERSEEGIEDSGIVAVIAGDFILRVPL